MKIYLNIEADSPAELDAAISGLASKIGAVTHVKAEITEPAVEQTPAAPEPEKKTRAKKADKPVEEPAKEEKAAPEPKVEEAKKPVADLTADEVKNTVIDWLNDLTEADQKSSQPDPEVRVKALQKLIKHFNDGAVAKLSEMIASHPDKWKAILDYVDERRLELKAATAEDEASEE